MDTIHDIFYKLCIQNVSLDEIDNLKFYLFRSLRNRLIDIKRTNREFPALFPQEEEIDEYLPFKFNVSIEDEIIMKEDSEEIRLKVENVLSRLTNRQREIIYLRYVQEYNYQEISDIMQISVEASRNLVSKSIVKLRIASHTLSMLLLFVK
jgi:RNA polymerase sigma factor (sigma-70 family)